LATIILVVIFRAYAQFPALYPFYKCILNVVFCESASITLIVAKWRLLSFVINWRKQKNICWMWDNSNIVFGQEFPGGKKKRETVRCHHATDSSLVAKIRVEVFAHFHTVAVRHHNSMWN
jgi:hypothetical protein